MVDFTLSPEDLLSLQRNYGSFLREQKEADVAQERADLVAIETHEQALELERTFAATQQQTHQEKSAALAEQISTLSRMREISQSLPLRVIEPVVGIFNPQFSRQRLAEDMQQRNTEISLIDARETMTREAVRSEQQQLQRALDVENARASLEQNQAQAVARAIQTQLKATEGMEYQKQLLVIQADDAELKNLRDSGVLTAQEYDMQMRLRKNQKLDDKMKVHQLRAAEFQESQRVLETATQEELLNDAWVEKHGFTAMQVQNQLRANSARAMGYDQLQMSVEAQRRHESIATLSNQELKQIAEGKTQHPSVKAFQAQEELEIRNDKSISRESRDRQFMRETQDHRVWQIDTVLTHMGESELRALRDSAVDGRVTLMHPETGAVLGDASLARVNELLTVATNSMAQRATIMSEKNALEAQVDFSVSVLSRALGIPVDDAADAAAGIRALASSAHMPSSAVVAAQSALKHLGLATDPNVPPDAQIQFMQQAQAAVAEAQKITRDMTTAGMDTTTKAAMDAFLESPIGQVTDQQGATLLSHGFMHNAHTGKWAYNQSLDIMSNALWAKVTGSDVVKAVGKKGKVEVNLEALLAKAPKLDVAVAQTLSDPVVQKAIQAKIQQEYLTNLYAEAANAARLPGVANILGDAESAAEVMGASWDTGKLLERVAQEMQVQGRDVQEYVAVVRELMQGTADRLLTPEGPGAEQIAAINAQIFRNAGGVVLPRQAQADLTRALHRLPIGAVEGAPPGYNTRFPARGVNLPSIPKIPRTAGPHGIARQ